MAGAAVASPAAVAQDLDPPGGPVDAEPVTGDDPLGRHGRPDHGRDAELAGEHGRMRGRPAGVRDESGDLGEQDDPGRVRHLADEDVAVAHLVELVDRAHDAGDALDRPGRRPEAGDDALVVGLRLVEAVRVAPVDEIREGQLGRGRRPDPVARMEALGGLALEPARRDDLARRDRRRAADEGAQLVVAEEHDVIGLVEPAGRDQLPADLDEHQPDVRVGTLVDVEVVVRGERRHPPVDGVRGAHLLERLAGQPVEDLARGGLDVEPHRLDRAREVVVGHEVAADELDDRLHLLAHGREDELVAPHRVPAELALVRLDPLDDEPPAAFAGRSAPTISATASAAKASRSSGSSRTSFFIRHSASIESQLRSVAEFWSRPSNGSSTRPWCFSMTARRLRVADSCAKLSIQWIFQCRSWTSIASSRRQATSARSIPSTASRRASR